MNPYFLGRTISYRNINFVKYLIFYYEIKYEETHRIDSK